MDLDPGTARRAITAVMLRPRLWGTAVNEIRLLARPGWWRHWPPLPRPDADYLTFRMRTAYGDAAQAMSADEVLDYLRWCRRMRQIGG